MKLCASEPRAPRTLTAKVRSRKRGAPGRWAGMVYWLGARVRSRWRCAAPREVSVCWRAKTSCEYHLKNVTFSEDLSDPGVHHTTLKQDQENDY